MNANELLKELEVFPVKYREIEKAHNDRLNAIERNSRNDMQNNRNNSAQAQAEAAAVEKNIEKLKNQLTKQLGASMSKRAFGELGALVGDTEIKANYEEGAVEKVQADLKREYEKLRDLRNDRIGGLRKQGKSIERALSDKTAQENSEYEQKLGAYLSEMKKTYARYANDCLPSYSAGDEPRSADSIGEELNIGDATTKPDELYRKLSDESRLRVPLLVNIRNASEGVDGNIVIKIKTTDMYNGELENALVGVTMRYLENFPSGTLKIGIFGSVFTSQQKLNALFSAIARGGISILPQAASNQQELSKLLAAIGVRGDIINQKLLENESPDIFGLYEKGIATEPFQLVILQGAFKDISEENLNALYGCISGYYRCGIRFLIIDNFDAETYKNRSDLFKMTLSQICEHSTVFCFDAKGSTTEGGTDVEFASVSREFTQQNVYAFCKKYCESIGKKKASALTYERVGFGKESGGKDWDSISIPIGLEDPDVWRIELNCQQNPPIANLVIGVPGTGKSTLIDAMIINGAIKYSPDELVFQLLDFKDGVSSSVYTMEECKIPHVKVISQNNKPDEASIILYNIMTESERRNDEFKTLSRESGKQIRNISEYNRLVVSSYPDRRKMPRLVIVIDECQYLFEDEMLAKTCEDIVRKCRAQGIHLILATQTLSRKMWSTIKFVDGRYCFEIAKEDAEQLLDRKYIPLISSEVPKGSYMAFASNNSGQECHKIKIAYDCGKMAQYAKAIREKWSEYPIDIVEIGDKSALFITEAEFKEKCAAFSSGEGLTVPLGENYTDHTVVPVQFLNEKQSAMLMLGTRQDLADSLCTSVMLAANYTGSEVYAVDASRDQRLRARGEDLEGVTVGDENDYLSILGKVYKLYEERGENIRAEYKPVVFLVNAAQNIAAFVNDEKAASASEEPVYSNPLERLRMQQQTRTAQKAAAPVSGKATLFTLISNAYKVNIFVCFAIDSLMATSDIGEPVFGFQQKNILRNDSFKVLYYDVSDSQSVMEDSFKEKMMNGMSENMAILSAKQKFYFKFRVFRFASED